MKKILRFAIILLIGAIFGYVFHNPIDVKLKEKFGNEKVEKGKEIVENGTEKAVELGEAIKDTVEAKRAEKDES